VASVLFGFLVHSSTLLAYLHITLSAALKIPDHIAFPALSAFAFSSLPSSFSNPFSGVPALSSSICSLVFCVQLLA